MYAAPTGGVAARRSDDEMKRAEPVTRWTKLMRPYPPVQAGATWPPGRGLRPPLARAARPARFAVSGAVAGLTQLALLSLFVDRAMPDIPANALAFLLAAQVNFGLGQAFTWRDRPSGASPVRELVRRWAVFHGSIAGTAGLNMLVFIVARRWVPDLMASVLGIGMAAVVNYAVHDRVTFRPARPGRPVLEPVRGCRPYPHGARSADRSSRSER